jgi:hypothetical protein
MTIKNAHRPAPLSVLNPENIPLPSQILVLFGSTSELQPLVLHSLFLRAQRGEQIGVVIGDNHLDAYTLARLTRHHGFTPATVLSQIEFSRPFTCHQLHHCILDLVGDKIEQWSALYVLDLLDLFYDEDISYSIVSRTFLRSCALSHSRDCRFS